MPSGPGTAGDQIHELRLSHLQLREDIVGLRSAILEWPELDRLADNVAELRSGAAEITGLVRYLTARPPVMPSPTASVDLGPVIAGVDHLRSEVDDLRGQVVQLMVLAKKGLVSAPTPDDGSALLLGEIRDLRSQLADVVRSIESQTKESVGLTRAELDELHIVVVRARGEQAADAIDLGLLLHDLRREVVAARDELTALREAPTTAPQLPTMVPLIEELGVIRDELIQVRRRIALRAKAGDADPDTIERIADAVVARFAPSEETDQ